jgi:dTDP-4-amino-4,6-dideoxygalactose transaminase
MSWLMQKPINAERVTELLTENIATNQFTNYGPNVKRLESWIINHLKINADKYSVVVVCNASAGLQCLIDAINIVDNNKGDKKWATQAFTFPPSAQGTLKDALICDIDNEGGIDLFDPQLLDAKKANCLSGIIVTNIFGNIVDIDKYCSWSEKYGTALVFDNAATPYTFYKGQNACNYGTGSVISFHHTKPLGFGEGGAIIVQRKYETMVRRLTNFGIHNELKLPWIPEGNNYKMSEISAVYIIQYLEAHFNSICAHHTKLYHMAREYAHERGLQLYPNFADLDNNTQIIISSICFLDDKFTAEYIENMITTKQIMCRKYYHPLKSDKMNNTVNTYNKILCYPCNLGITEFLLD